MTLLRCLEIDTFAVNSAGAAGPREQVASQNPFPFGFIFNKANQLVDSEVTSMTGEGSTATYSVTSTGSLAPIDNKSRSEPLPLLVAESRRTRSFRVPWSDTGNGAPPGSTIALRTGWSASEKLKFLGE